MMCSIGPVLRDVRALLGAYFNRVGTFQSEALLALVYWTAVAIASVLMRATRRSLLPDSFGSGRSHWIERRHERPDDAYFSRQF